MAVYAAQFDQQKDISGVQAWGEIRVIRPSYVYPDQVDDDDRLPWDVEARLREAAMEFDPNEDYVLLVGDHIQLVYFVAQIVAVHGRFRMLRYDKKADGYYAVEVSTEKEA